MAQNIRRYKGVRPIPKNKGYTKIGIDGTFSEWNNISTVYRDTKGDVIHRDHDGYGGLHYTNTSGRNDIDLSKVAFGKKEIFFYAKTVENLTPSSDSNWMLLLIDADKNPETGWYGYDFIVNRTIKDSKTSTLMRYDEKTETWKEVCNIPFSASGKELELSIPRKVLGIKGNTATFDFKWCDNPQSLKDPISLCTDGDAAPNRRFNYRCIWKK